MDACLGKHEDIVQKYLKEKVGINMNHTKWQLLNLRENATNKEVDIAYKYYVLLMHPDKPGFNSFLTDHMEEFGISHVDVAICKAKLFGVLPSLGQEQG